MILTKEFTPHTLSLPLEKGTVPLRRGGRPPGKMDRLPGRRGHVA